MPLPSDSRLHEHTLMRRFLTPGWDEDAEDESASPVIYGLMHVWYEKELADDIIDAYNEEQWLWEK